MLTVASFRSYTHTPNLSLTSHLVKNLWVWWGQTVAHSCSASGLSHHSQWDTRQPQHWPGEKSVCYHNILYILYFCELYNLFILILPTCKIRGFPFTMLLKVTLTPSGIGLVSIVSSVMAWSVGMVTVRGKDWLTPGLNRRDNSWGWRNIDLSTGSVLQKFRSWSQEGQYLKSQFLSEQIMTL